CRDRLLTLNRPQVQRARLAAAAALTRLRTTTGLGCSDRARGPASDVGRIGIRKRRAHCLSQARPPRRPLRPPSGAEFTITAFSLRRRVTVQPLSNCLCASATAALLGRREMSDLSRESGPKRTP